MDGKMKAKTRFVSVACAVVFGLSGCGGSDDGAGASGAVEAVDAPSVPDSEEPDDTADADDAEASEPADERQTGPVVFTEGYTDIVAGDYQVNTMGTPFTFTLDEDLFVFPNSHGQFVLAHPASNGPGDRELLFMRLTDLANPADPSSPVEERNSWPATDFDGWLDAVDGGADGIVVSNRAETTVGGLPAIRADIDFTDLTCPVGPGPCMTFGANTFWAPKDIWEGSRFRVWSVEQGDETPLMVMVGTVREEDSDWFDLADSVLSTLTFGDVAPNTVFVAGPGLVELPFLDGIEVEFDREAIAVSDLIGRVSIDELPAEMEFLSNPLNVSGDQLVTVDDLLGAFKLAGISTTELEPAMVGGLTSRVIEFGSNGGPPVLKFSSEASGGWRSPPKGQAWVIEHPERGLLIMTAEAFQDVDEVFPKILAFAELAIASLEFVDQG